MFIWVNEIVKQGTLVDWETETMRLFYYTKTKVCIVIYPMTSLPSASLNS